MLVGQGLSPSSVNEKAHAGLGLDLDGGKVSREAGNLGTRHV